MKNYKYLLFDLDGTLTYSHPGIYNCIRYALEAFGRPQPTEKQLRACVGPPLTYSFSEIFGMSEEETEAAVKNIGRDTRTKGFSKTNPFRAPRSCLRR